MYLLLLQQQGFCTLVLFLHEFQSLVFALFLHFLQEQEKTARSRQVLFITIH